MTIRNYIKINGEYVAQEDIPEEQRKEIATTILNRLAKGFGYKPVEQSDLLTGVSDSNNGK